MKYNLYLILSMLIGVKNLIGMHNTYYFTKFKKPPPVNSYDQIKKQINSLIQASSENIIISWALDALFHAEHAKDSLYITLVLCNAGLAKENGGFSSSFIAFRKVVENKAWLEKRRAAFEESMYKKYSKENTI